MVTRQIQVFLCKMGIVPTPSLHIYFKYYFVFIMNNLGNNGSSCGDFQKLSRLEVERSIYLLQFQLWLTELSKNWNKKVNKIICPGHNNTFVI